jgi:uncharacterized membrane protein YhhN
VTGNAALLLALAAVVAFVDWAAVRFGQRRLEYAAKPAVMVLLVGVAVTLEPVDDAARVAIVVGLVCSLAGDVFLMLPERPDGSRSLFVAGLTAFLAGHVAYIVAFELRGQTGLWFVIGLGVVALGVATIGLRVVRGVRDGPHSSLVGPVVAYIAVISVMVATAFGTRNPFAVVGALSFYLSDATLAWNRFVEEHPYGRLATMVTYHLGQALIVLSLV